MIHDHTTSECVITCPHCGTAKNEVMPDDACLFFYECTGCGSLLKKNLVRVAFSAPTVRCRVRRCRGSGAKGMQSSLYF